MAKKKVYWLPKGFFEFFSRWVTLSTKKVKILEMGWRLQEYVKWTKKWLETWLEGQNIANVTSIHILNFNSEKEATGFFFLWSFCPSPEFGLSKSGVADIKYSISCQIVSVFAKKIAKVAQIEYQLPWRQKKLEWNSLKPLKFSILRSQNRC